MLQSIHSIAKKKIFRKDRSNDVAKEEELTSVKITGHNSTHSENHTFVSIRIYLHPRLNFYLRDFNAIFLNQGQACDGYIFTQALYYDHAVTSGCVQEFHWLQRDFNSTCQSRTICSKSPTVIKNILCFPPFFVQGDDFVVAVCYQCQLKTFSWRKRSHCLTLKIKILYILLSTF